MLFCTERKGKGQEKQRRWHGRPDDLCGLQSACDSQGAARCCCQTDASGRTGARHAQAPPPRQLLPAPHHGGRSQPPRSPGGLPLPPPLHGRGRGLGAGARAARARLSRWHGRPLCSDSERASDSEQLSLSHRRLGPRGRETAGRGRACACGRGRAGCVGTRAAPYGYDDRDTPRAAGGMPRGPLTGGKSIYRICDLRSIHRRRGGRRRGGSCSSSPLR